MVTGFSKFFIVRISILKVLVIAFTHIRNPLRALRALHALDLLRKKYSGDKEAVKGFKANGRYFFYNHVPGFPSRAFDHFHREELNLIERFNPRMQKLRSVILSVTKKCPLNCEHCYELKLLNKQEILSLIDLKKIVSDLQEQGVTQIYLSGGEPMTRFNDLIEILKSASDRSDFWLITSGINLSLEKARILKKTRRLTGVSISVDHYLPDEHNAFRRRAYSYEEAINAVKNCKEADLAVGMAICTTRSFVNWDNLIRYAQLAKELGAHFIQLQEPYAVGGYEGKEVTLTDSHINVLDNFYRELNTNKKYRDMPIVVYHGYHQRRIGCFGGGNRYLYIDSDGNVHSCPYCQTKKANILEDNLAKCLVQLEAKGCTSFKNIPHNKAKELYSDLVNL